MKLSGLLGLQSLGEMVLGFQLRSLCNCSPNTLPLLLKHTGRILHCGSVHTSLLLGGIQFISGDLMDQYGSLVAFLSVIQCLWF